MLADLADSQEWSNPTPPPKNARRTRRKRSLQTALAEGDHLYETADAIVGKYHDANCSIALAVVSDGIAFDGSKAAGVSAVSAMASEPELVWNVCKTPPEVWRVLPCGTIEDGVFHSQPSMLGFATAIFEDGSEVELPGLPFSDIQGGAPAGNVSSAAPPPKKAKSKGKGVQQKKESKGEAADKPGTHVVSSSVSKESAAQLRAQVLQKVQEGGNYFENTQGVGMRIKVRVERNCCILQAVYLSGKSIGVQHSSSASKAISDHMACVDKMKSLMKAVSSLEVVPSKVELATMKANHFSD